jgi:hypothetical protein
MVRFQLLESSLWAFYSFFSLKKKNHVTNINEAWYVILGYRGYKFFLMHDHAAFYKEKITNVLDFKQPLGK